MDSSKSKLEADFKIEPKEEESFEIKEEPIHLVTLRPAEVEELKKEEPIDDFQCLQAEPQPSTSRAVAEVRVSTPPLPEFKVDPFCFAPRGRFSPPPPPADRARRRSIPGGHASATPRLKFQPYQHKR